MKKHLKHSNFSFKIFFVVCLFPANIRNFLGKEGKKWWETDKLKKILENRQSEYFCQTYFSKLNRDQIEKKLWYFEDNPVSRGETFQKIPKRRHDLRWVLTQRTKTSFFFGFVEDFEVPTKHPHFFQPLPILFWKKKFLFVETKKNKTLNVSSHINVNF